MKILDKWNRSTLTPRGKEEITEQAAALRNMYTYIFYSPLKRTEQTARAFLKNPGDNIESMAIPQLTEIYISPPRIPGRIKLKIKTWVFLCLLKSFYTLSIIRYFHQARQIIHLVKKVNDDLLIISHQARIFSIIVYAFLSPRWRVIRTDFNPAGVCIIERRGK